MRIHPGALVMALGMVPVVAGAAPKKAAMPALLERARYVTFRYDLGDGVVEAMNISAVASNTLPDERRAITAIREDIESWGRFAVTDRPEDAEILIVVRMGRRGG